MTNSPISNSNVLRAYARDPSTEPAADQQQPGLGGAADGGQDGQAQPAAAAKPANGAPTAQTGAEDSASSHAPGTVGHNLETLAAAVGLDPDQLLDQVKSGQGLSDLLGQTGDTGYGSTVGQTVRGGILLDLYA